MNVEATAAQLADSLYLKFIMVFHIVTSFAGIVSLSYMLWNRKTLKLLAHQSLTLLMDIHTFWTYVMCITVLLNNSTTLYAHLTMRTPSDILVSASNCAMRALPLIVTSYGSIFSQLAMAAERYRASSALASYEQSGRYFGHLLNAIQLAAILLVCSGHMAFYGWDWTAAHCTCVTPEGETVQKSIGMSVVICEVITIVTFKRLLTRNCRLRDNSAAALTLSERYQLTENIRMLKLLLPIIWSHTLLGIIASIFFFTLAPIYPTPEMYPMIEETATILYLQGIFMPVIFVYRFKEKQRHERTLRSVNTTTGATLASHHTKIISELW